MIATTSEAAARAAARLDQLVPRLIETRREVARLQAEEARLLAEAATIAEEWASDSPSTSDAEFALRSTATEIAAAWRVSDRTVQRQLTDATTLVSGFPATHASLEAGRISLTHARTIMDAGARIEQPELRDAYENAILPYAEAESASRLGPVARRRAQWFLETTITERHQQARADRRVMITDLDDGMAQLVAILPAVIAYGVHDRLGEMARDVTKAERRRAAEAEHRGDVAEGEGDAAAIVRSLDQVRADILADLLLAGDPVAHVGTVATGLGAIRPRVQVTVPVLTLLDEKVADPFEATILGGFGPIDPETARALATDAPGWDRVLTHPVTGAVLGVDRYQPSEEMRRHLRVRDQHCRFPGCRMPLRMCDADHTVDYQFGGPTACENLGHLCRRHHMLKHNTAWTVVQSPGGVLSWTSPTGRVYPDHPTSRVAFSVDEEFDPAPF